MKQTIAARAAELGISRATAHNWKRAGVDIYSDEAVRLHKSQRRTDGGEQPVPSAKGGDAEMRAARLRKLQAEAERAELSLATLRGDYFAKAEVAASQAGIAHVCNQLLRAATAELPGLVAGLSPADAEKKLKGWTGGWAERLRDAQSDVWKRARAATMRDLRGDARRAAATLAAQAASAGGAGRSGGTIAEGV